MSGIGTLAKAGAKEGAELAAKYVPKIQKLLDSGDTAGAAAVAKEARTEIAASSFVIPDKKLKQLTELLNKADPVDKNLFPADLSSVTTTPVQNRVSGDIGLPKEGGVIKGPVTPLTRENQPLHQDKGVDFSLETAIAPYKKPGALVETLPEEKALSTISGMSAENTSPIMRNVTPPKSKYDAQGKPIVKTEDITFKPLNKTPAPVLNKGLPGVAAPAGALAFLTAGDTPMFGNKQEEEKPVSPLPRMDITGTKVAEAPTSEVKPPATTAPTSQKTAPANANKREQAAKLGVDEQIDKLNQAKETASSTARENYDRVLSKLETLKTRIDSFDSRERQILAYERLGDMLARAFANIGAGLTAAKQGVAIKPLDLSPGDQSSRYADLQALSKQRYGQLEAERDTAGKVYSEELRAADQARQAEFDKLRLQQQAAEAEKDRALRKQLQDAENASREKQYNFRIDNQYSRDAEKYAKAMIEQQENDLKRFLAQKVQDDKDLQSKAPTTRNEAIKRIRTKYNIHEDVKDADVITEYTRVANGIQTQKENKLIETRKLFPQPPPGTKVASAPEVQITPEAPSIPPAVEGQIQVKDITQGSPTFGQIRKVKNSAQVQELIKQGKFQEVQ